MKLGIKADSIFNRLVYYHVCQPGLPPCLAHDLFEGVVDYDLSLCLHFLVTTRKWFSYTLLNSRIKSFPGESANKPNVVQSKGEKLGVQAAQNWWLLRFLLILFYDKSADAKDEVWQLLLLLREFAEFVCAPKIAESQVAYMKVILDEYLEQRFVLFPNKKFRLKHHYLLHYADPTLKHSTNTNLDNEV